MVMVPVGTWADRYARRWPAAARQTLTGMRRRSGLNGSVTNPYLRRFVTREYVNRYSVMHILHVQIDKIGRP
jgi:hypothetical protein